MDREWRRKWTLRPELRAFLEEESVPASSFSTNLSHSQLSAEQIEKERIVISSDDENSKPCKKKCTKASAKSIKTSVNNAKASAKSIKTSVNNAKANTKNLSPSKEKEVSNEKVTKAADNKLSSDDGEEWEELN
ncbi:hypothetical protein GUITHDRAFT_145960 [Guillardia theta CCMP2712]|uniref:Uncharacterized protein n=1 Tax=Guillardia theta (strain CCMP2712) TaxID=905079 RepID=L1IJ53_GUITC|nr:hypothetical protein GUITHDRAFT_145960 [Guillardia theta CCMP2712]EKX36142.1 hypothetical protein GUITHDRAFT_145960 [Guillardia theta CCMP2712]|eukprot:XP_005823122.1 hypothetical protein GUITHDRAFT_145960 [Guillardia theta CCMP2712]